MPRVSDPEEECPGAGPGVSSVPHPSRGAKGEQHRKDRWRVLAVAEMMKEIIGESGYERF